MHLIPMSDLKARSESQASTEPKEPERDELPPQLHAGKVGYGPNLDPAPTIGEKFSGLKEELKGKLKHDPELVKHGRILVSGEEKRKNLFGKNEPSGPSSPFDAGTPEKSSPVHQSNEEVGKEQASTGRREDKEHSSDVVDRENRY